MSVARKKSPLLSLKSIHLCLPLVLAASWSAASAQSVPSTAPQQSQASQPAPAQTPDAPQGTVLFQSHGEPPAPQSSPEALKDWQTTEKPGGPELTDVERGAITFTAYDLDVRLTPATSALSARARVTLRNDGATPLPRIALQISSTLRWESATVSGSAEGAKLDLAQHLIDTDADHTGKANEAVIALPAVLKPGESVTLNTFYAGTAGPSTGRLERLGASPQQASSADWDGIRPGRVALRGFGNVLWYPVASPQVFLGEGAQLFDAIGQTELRQRSASIRFRVGVEYDGDPPEAAYFCGRRQQLIAQSDAPNTAISAGAGIATAEFQTQALGFRMPSFFVVENRETLLAPLPPLLARATALSSSSSASSADISQIPADASSEIAPSTTSNGAAPMLAVESADNGALPALADSAQRVAPLLQSWLGEQPLSALTVIDNSGQPFEDGPLLLAPVGSLVASTAQPAMAHSLTHAWVQTGQPWMDEGLAQFFALLWVEREQGREAALLQLNNLLQPVSVAEPNIEQGKPSPAGQPLISATSETFFRRKAGAVWFMLRQLAGEDALKATLRAWRMQPLSEAPAADQARAFEALLEKRSGKDLRWFFDDWVLHDRGLADLNIAHVDTRQLPAGANHSIGWLVAVTVHNDGAAAAEVPVVVHSGALSTASTLRVPGFESATARILVEAAPTDVVVNDGSTPELQNVRHVRALTGTPQSH